ncbi:hypothetical protein E3G52_000424 [Mycobacteroides abscessus]|nr:hypothetical protein [Mycobacteroides abscessus]
MGICAEGAHILVTKHRRLMSSGLRSTLAVTALAAVIVGGVKVIGDYTSPGSGFSTIATGAADPTGPTGGPSGPGGMNGSQFQPPGLPPQMPDYQGGINQPPLDQNSGISIYNTGSPGAQQIPGQQGAQQPQQGWDQPAHGTQMPNYSTAPGYTQGPGQPNPNYQAPQQQAPQQGQQGNQNQQTQQANQNQQSQEPQQQNQQDRGDQQRQQKCGAIKEDMAIDSALQLLDSMSQVGEVAQQIAQIAEMILPKGGGGGLGPDGSRKPGRQPITPFECSYCPPDKPVKPKPDPKPDNQPVMTPDTKPDNKPVPTQDNKPEPTKADKPKDKSDDQLLEDVCDVLKTPFGGVVCEAVKQLICFPSDPNCKGPVPICFKKGTTALTPDLIAQRQKYIDLGNDLIERNQALGGEVWRRIGTRQFWEARGKREAEAAKKANPGAYAGGLVGGHGPDLLWEGLKDDDRPVFPMDSSLNGSIGSQQRIYKWGYVVTEFQPGNWATTANGVERCIAEVAMR